MNKDNLSEEFKLKLLDIAVDLSKTGYYGYLTESYENIDHDASTIKRAYDNLYSLFAEDIHIFQEDAHFCKES